MYRARRYWENLNGGDPVTQAIAIVALILFAIFAIPYLPLPYVVSGVGCYNLSSPAISGSSQSILGSQASQNDLRLELVPDPINLKTTDPLNMDVRFINNSMRPLTLFLPQGEYVFRYDEQESGILFSIVGVTDGQPRGEGANVRPPFIAPYANANVPGCRRLDWHCPFESDHTELRRRSSGTVGYSASAISGPATANT